jgi:hypothetical protein
MLVDQSNVNVNRDMPGPRSGNPPNIYKVAHRNKVEYLKPLGWRLRYGVLAGTGEH